MTSIWRSLDEARDRDKINKTGEREQRGDWLGENDYRRQLVTGIVIMAGKQAVGQ